MEDRSNSTMHVYKLELDAVSNTRTEVFAPRYETSSDIVTKKVAQSN